MVMFFAAQLAQARVMAIIRGTDSEAAVAAGRVLLEEGIRLTVAATSSVARSPVLSAPPMNATSFGIGPSVRTGSCTMCSSAM